MMHKKLCIHPCCKGITDYMIMCVFEPVSADWSAVEPLVLLSGLEMHHSAQHTHHVHCEGHLACLISVPQMQPM